MQQTDVLGWRFMLDEHPEIYPFKFCIIMWFSVGHKNSSHHQFVEYHRLGIINFVNTNSMCRSCRQYVE